MIIYNAVVVVVVVGAIVLVVVVVDPHPPDLIQISSSNCLEICQRRDVLVLPPICLLGIAIVIIL